MRIQVHNTSMIMPNLFKPFSSGSEAGSKIVVTSLMTNRLLWTTTWTGAPWLWGEPEGEVIALILHHSDTPASRKWVTRALMCAKISRTASVLNPKINLSFKTWNQHLTKRVFKFLAQLKKKFPTAQEIHDKVTVLDPPLCQTGLTL